MDVPGLLPRRGVKHLIKHTIGREVRQARVRSFRPQCDLLQLFTSLRRRRPSWLKMPSMQCRCVDELEMPTRAHSGSSCPPGEQACSSEFINLVVSEARQRVAREGREVVTETDLLAVLSLMGFRGFHEPLKSYLQECEAEDRVCFSHAAHPPVRIPAAPLSICSQEAKRPKATPLQEGHGAATKEGACSADAGVTAKEGACSADAGMDAATEERACSAGARMSTAITGGSACSGEIMADAATDS